MQYLFVVQGEGRGHFTQAISLKVMLEKNGHEVVAVMVGRSSNRALPDFFLQKIETEIIPFLSPNFLPAPKGKKPFILLSVLYNLLLIPQYIESMLKIRKTIVQKQPDVVVNFYELLCGLTYGFLNPSVPMINIAHQYYFQTEHFSYTGTNRKGFRLLNFYSQLTALHAHKILALSFRDKQSCQRTKIKIVPPLLRNEVLAMQPTSGNYIHGYMLNNGYAETLAAWSNEHPELELHFFWDKKGVDAEHALTPNLTMHALNDVLFLNYMAGAAAYATTGGFESVCEAMYLQKPVLMVPTHIEQACNVMDALSSKIGVASDNFQLDKLISFVPYYQANENFTYWAQSAQSIVLQELTNLEAHKEEVLVSLT